MAWRTEDDALPPDCFRGRDASGFCKFRSTSFLSVSNLRIWLI